MKNNYKIISDTLIVYNRKDNREILFDTEDFDKINQYTWYISHLGYAVSSINTDKKRNIKQHTIRSHRLIMGIKNNLFIDHINGNKIDNRKSNLRIVTNQQNQHNNHVVKGYTWNKSKNKWHAQINVNKKKIHLGDYNTETEARIAYLEGKKKYHPTAPHHLYK